jgi:hypothetical protein
VTTASPSRRVPKARRDSSITPLLLLDPGVAVAGQLELGDIKAVAAGGFAAAIDKRPDGEALLARAEPDPQCSDALLPRSRASVRRLELENQ